MPGFKICGETWSSTPCRHGTWCWCWSISFFFFFSSYRFLNHFSCQSTQRDPAAWLKWVMYISAGFSPDLTRSGNQSPKMVCPYAWHEGSFCWCFCSRRRNCLMFTCILYAETFLSPVYNLRRMNYIYFTACICLCSISNGSFWYFCYLNSCSITVISSSPFHETLTIIL